MANKNNNNLIIIVVVIVGILILLGSFGGYRMMGGYNPGFMLLSWILNILIIILIIIGIIWLIKHLSINGKRINFN